uniref:Uncharacterized protein n=1 Tax=Oryza punctata TaxID=4537 RepID=A0A0E0K4B4_ORYPU
MGCYHLGKFVSKALGKCNGRERAWREERLDYTMAYPPGPPTETYYMRPVARTVTFSGANSVYVIPPAEPPHQQAAEPQPQTSPPPPQQQQHGPEHHQAQPQPQQEPPTLVQDTPPAEPKQPKRGKNKKSGRVRFGPEPPPPEQQQQQQQQQQPPQLLQQQQEQTQQATNAGAEHAPARHATSAPPGYFRYTPSPLPRWEAATPRRHEYFSGEYRYSYPTPVREGIYRMATDANRLTTIFSEENPNACAIM